MPHYNKDKLLYVMEYIRDNIEKKRTLTPGNTNSPISDTPTYKQKSKISNNLGNAIYEIISDKLVIKEYFPVNNEK